MKHFALAAVLTVCLLAAAGCGKKENGKVTETPTPTEELTYLENRDSEIPTPSVPVRDLGGITVTVADWWSDENWNLAANAYEEAFNDMLRDFEKEANFSFERKNAGFGNGEEYAAKIGEAIQADNPPGDVISVPLSNIGTLLRDGCLLDVSGAESVSFDDEYKWKHHNGITDFLSINGKQYGFDWEENEAGLGVFFNKELLTKAGIDPKLLYDLQRMHCVTSYLEPDADASKWTWEAFLDICEQLKNAGLGEDTAIVAGQDALVVYGALLSNGTNVIEKDEQGLLRVNGADTPAIREALSFAQELKEQGYLVSMSEEECRMAFAEGKAAILIAEEQMSTKMGTDGNESFGFVCFPFGPTQGKLTSIVLDDVAYFVPNCTDCKDNVESILYAFNCYTEHPECLDSDPYYAHSMWKAKYYWRYADETAATDTLYAMLEYDTVPIAMNATVLLADFDHSWTAEIMSGRDIDEVLAAHSDDWTAQVEAFNKLFT
ncbi:MAG: extracellular solute-binding protein [Lachnospiraceae bacterium]|nr:extracellular solute-binding protein [Lachnospiraceae bacterium]